MVIVSALSARFGLLTMKHSIALPCHSHLLWNRIAVVDVDDKLQSLIMLVTPEEQPLNPPPQSISIDGLGLEDRGGHTWWVIISVSQRSCMGILGEIS